MCKSNSGRRNFIKKTTMAAAVAPFSFPTTNFMAEVTPSSKEKKRYALVGTGTRGSSSWAKPIVDTYGQHAELVALCDINHGRMAFAKSYIGTKAPTYHSSEFEKMIRDTRPDTVMPVALTLAVKSMLSKIYYKRFVYSLTDLRS